MTTRKRLRIAVWIAFLAIAGVAGVSYLRVRRFQGRMERVLR